MDPFVPIDYRRIATIRETLRRTHSIPLIKLSHKCDTQSSDKMMAMLMCMIVCVWAGCRRRRGGSCSRWRPTSSSPTSLASGAQPTRSLTTMIWRQSHANLTSNLTLSRHHAISHVKSHAITSSRYLTRSHCLPACSLSNAETGTSRM